MRIDVYQQHGKDHGNKHHGDDSRAICGCDVDVGTMVTVDVAALPPIGSGIWVQSRGTGPWREVTVERYTFGDPKNPGRILCHASYDRDDE
jgi:hypothetical protein